MARILIFSDTHGRTSRMECAVLEHPEADYVIHLGDCVRDTETLLNIAPTVKLFMVCGNCDFRSDADATGEIMIAGKRIFFTHGHLFSVKSGLEKLINEGRNRKCDAVLYGHTHVANKIYDDGMYIFNPGSISRPQYGRASFGIMDIVNGQIALNIVEL